MEHRLKMLIPIMCLFVLGAFSAAGCGKSAATATTSSRNAAGAGTKSSSNAGVLEKSIANVRDKTPEERSAACEALRYAEDANAGSTFKASAVKVYNGWARVAVEQTDVPADEAVSFAVFLRKSGTGSWEVADSGTDVTPDTLPGAPEEIFK